MLYVLDKETTGRIDLIIEKQGRDLARDIAHELNQPLQVIRGYAQELEASGFKGPMLTEIIGQADRAASIIKYMRGKLTEFTCVRDMKGLGYEYLVDKEGTVLARFYNGQMIITAVPTGNLETTRSVA